MREVSDCFYEWTDIDVPEDVRRKLTEKKDFFQKNRTAVHYKY